MISTGLVTAAEGTASARMGREKQTSDTAACSGLATGARSRSASTRRPEPHRSRRPAVGDAGTRSRSAGWWPPTAAAGKGLPSHDRRRRGHPARRCRHGRSSGTTGPRSPLSVRFGVGLPVAHHPVPEWASSLEAITAVTRAAAAAGFEHVFVTDHPAPPQRWLAAGGHSSLDPFVALTAAVAADPGIRVLTNLSVLGYRHPLVLAKSAATLDRLSGGRLTLGVGVGYLAAEFDALGVSFDERNDRFDHALDVLDAVWRGTASRSLRAMAGPQSFFPIHHRFSSRSRSGLAAMPDGPVSESPNGRRGGCRCQSGCVREDHEIPVLDGPDDLAHFIADLHRRADEAGRDDPIDIVFVVPDGGPRIAGFQADVHRRAIDECAALGVTGNNVTLDTTSLEHTLDVIGRYGADVIGAGARDGEGRWCRTVSPGSSRVGDRRRACHLSGRHPYRCGGCVSHRLRAVADCQVTARDDRHRAAACPHRRPQPPRPRHPLRPSRARRPHGECRRGSSGDRICDRRHPPFGTPSRSRP